MTVAARGGSATLLTEDLNHGQTVYGVQILALKANFALLIKVIHRIGYLL
jgi:hypothetical protein